MLLPETGGAESVATFGAVALAFDVKPPLGASRIRSFGKALVFSSVGGKSPESREVILRGLKSDDCVLAIADWLFGDVADASRVPSFVERSSRNTTQTRTTIPAMTDTVINDDRRHDQGATRDSGACIVAFFCA